MLQRAGAVLTKGARFEFEDMMRCSVHEGDLKSIKRLVDGGISPLVFDYLGRSLLHLAVEFGQHTV